MATSMPFNSRRRVFLRRIGSEKFVLRDAIVMHPAAFVDSPERSQSMRLSFTIENVVDRNASPESRVGD
jgi:hypothetical protein